MSSVQFLIGRSLGKYEVLEHIGHGGMSEVYKGQQAQLHRLVAIKVMHPFLADDEGFVVRFQREARIVATLRHPNIVQVYDFDHNDELGLYYMVMEYIDGPTLKDRLLEGPLSLEETVHIGAAIADALDYAHRRGMVHRDIKPANILFIDNKEPVLTDFGIARMVTLSGLTASGAMVGTPAYMAPEIGKGKAGTALSDIYSLSVLLYQTVTGSLPFSAESPMGMVLEHVNTPPPSPVQLNPAIPEALAAVILRGLEKEPAARFVTAGDMAAALRTSLDPSAPAVAPPDSARVESGQTPPPAVATPPAEVLAVEPPPMRAAPAAGAASPEEDLLDEARLIKSWNPLSHRHVTPEGELARPETVPARTSWLLTGIVLGVALLAISWGIWLATAGRLMSTDGEPTTTGGVTPQALSTSALPPTAEMPFRRPTAAAEPDAGAQVAATPTLDCTLRVDQDGVRIDPAAVVAPGTTLTTRIAVHNSGHCPWPGNTGLYLSNGPSLGALEAFTVTTLAPGESILWVLPMVAPDELGVYTSTWQMRAEDGTPFGSRILVTVAVEDIDPLPPAPTLAIDLAAATPEPLALSEPTLLDWQDHRDRGTWSGTVQLLGTGGSGQYRYFVQRILPANELVDGLLAFEAPLCEPVALDLVVLSGVEVLSWQGEIAYPAPERCN